MIMLWKIKLDMGEGIIFGEVATQYQTLNIYYWVVSKVNCDISKLHIE